MSLCSINAVVTAMLQSHSAGRDVCVVGPKGCGKSAVARLFAARLGYGSDLFSVYKDMSARDLLQRRSTDSLGNTTWHPSPLVTAALHGHALVLDGLNRLPGETLSILQVRQRVCRHLVGAAGRLTSCAAQRLVLDRELELFDGTRLITAEHYASLEKDGIVPPAAEAVAAFEASGRSVSQLLPLGGLSFLCLCHAPACVFVCEWLMGACFGRQLGEHAAGEGVGDIASTTIGDGVRVLPIHPSFRIVAVAAPPSSDEQWLHPETIGMFDIVQMPTLTVDEVRRHRAMHVEVSRTPHTSRFCGRCNPHSTHTSSARCSRRHRLLLWSSCAPLLAT